MSNFGLSVLSLCLAAIILLSGADSSRAEGKPTWIKQSMKKLEKELGSKYSQDQQERLLRGMNQVASFWHPEDGDADVFESFITINFADDQIKLDAMFERFEHLLDKLDGHMTEILLKFREQSDLDIGPIYPFDEIFAAYSPSAHVNDDFFKNKLAFIVLLNFPLTTLEERLTKGEEWTRRQWAETRLAHRFSKRIPAIVNQAISEANATADHYIAGYNIWMHHLLDDKGERLFPPKLRLLSHWNLRDELKAHYGTGAGAMPKQQMIQKVMERIVDQTIPDVVIDNPHVDWNPYSNEVWPAKVSDSDSPPPPDMKVSNSPEPDTRYAVLLKTFQASRKLDPYSPTAPTLIERRFNENREIPEERVQGMFEKMLSSPLLSDVAKLIAYRLDRPLEPFDIWYNGFRPRGTYSQQELDDMVKKKYPTPKAFRADMPNILMKLDFDKKHAEYLTAHILVDPARGSGHAWGAGMRGGKAHLRTRVSKDGMDYKGYNIAIHELGHNVEQVFTLNDIDYTSLEGVPNTGFTEAIAFVFQARDLEILGMPRPDEKSEAFKVLDDYWGACEIAAVALVDMAIWHWMYEHPECTAAELKDATIQIAKDTWNRFYAPIFEQEDVILLGVYSHIIHSFLYLPDYPLGHLIATQVEAQIKQAGSVGSEVERILMSGNIAPDLWMKHATGSQVGPEALMMSTEDAIKVIRGWKPE